MSRILFLAVLAFWLTTGLTYGQDRDLEIRWSPDDVFLGYQSPAFPRSAIWKMELDRSLKGVLAATESSIILLKCANDRLVESLQTDTKKANSSELAESFCAIFAPPKPSNDNMPSVRKRTN